MTKSKKPKPSAEPATFPVSPTLTRAKYAQMIEDFMETITALEDVSIEFGKAGAAKDIPAMEEIMERAIRARGVLVEHARGLALQCGPRPEALAAIAAGDGSDKYAWN